MLRLHFVSMNQEWINAIKQEFFALGVADFTCDDIQKVPRDDAVFVSAANSLGFMDGGIDLVLSRKMFPGCERLVRQKIAELDIKTKLGRPYLPIGSALTIPVGPTTDLYVAPTMFLPHDVSETRNAYYAFLAVLALWSKQPATIRKKTIVITSLCCVPSGGKMDPKISAHQMREAYDVWSSGVTVYSIPHNDVNVFLGQCHDNREIGDDDRFIRSFQQPSV